MVEREPSFEGRTLSPAASPENSAAKLKFLKLLVWLLVLLHLCAVEQNQ